MQAGTILGVAGEVSVMTGQASGTVGPEASGPPGTGDPA